MCGSSYQPITRSGPVPRFAAIAALGRTSSQVMYSTLTATPVASWNFFEFAFQASSSALMNPLQRSSRSCASFSTGNIGAYFAAGACANERVAAPAARPRPHFMNERRSVMAVPPGGGDSCARRSGMSKSAQLAREPGEAFVRGPFRAVFEADGAHVAHLVQVGEECRDRLLAGAGLVAAGDVGDLDVRDQREVTAQHGARVLTHHAHVVLVELQPHVGRPGRVRQVRRDVRRRGEVAGHVDGVDVLDQQGDAGLRHQRRGRAQVRHCRPARLVARDARRRDAGERVQAARPEPLRRGDRLAHRLEEFRFPAGHRQETPLSLRPIARPRIEQHQLEAELAQRPLHRRGVQVVHEEDLDLAKSRLGSGAEAIQDGQLQPEQGEVRREARHVQLRGLSTVTPAASSQRRTSEAMSFAPSPRARASRKRCSATAPSSSGTFAAFASSWISPRSLRSSVTLVAGPKSREMNRGRLRVIIVEPPNEVPITSSTTRGSAPSFAPNTAASAMAAVCTPTRSWLISFTTCPAPAGPQSLMFLPKARNTGRARSNAPWSPPTITVSVPACAPAGPPETGASRNSAPRSRPIAAQRRLCATLTVEWSAYICPGRA